jgi:hypothetical protein
MYLTLRARARCSPKYIVKTAGLFFNVVKSGTELGVPMQTGEQNGQKTSTLCEGGASLCLSQGSQSPLFSIRVSNEYSHIQMNL